MLRPCIAPGCGEPTEGSRCPEHAPKDTKVSSRKRGYDTAIETRPTHAALV